MEFAFESVYDQKAVTAMARALRKTLRKKHSRRSHVIGWIVAAAALGLPFVGGLVVTGKTVLTWGFVLVMVLTLLFEDSINGYFARKRALPGTEHTTTQFEVEGYHSVNAAGETRWNYENVKVIAETGDYFVFVLNANHAQVYDKRTMTGGTAEEFRAFLQEITGKSVEVI